MQNVRLSSVYGALLGTLILSAPFFFVFAQNPDGVSAVESSVEETTEQTPAQSATQYDPKAYGITVESIPNSQDVIGDFVVGPGKFEAFMEPGESLTTEILITNRTGVDRRFNIDVEDMQGSSDGQEAMVLLGDDRGPYSIKDYLSFPTRSFDLKHGQRVRLPVTITIPEDAEPGGFYGSALVNTVSIGIENDVESGTAALKSPVIQRIGVLLFITVPGDNIYEGELKNFHIEPHKKWYDGNTFNFVITYENSGTSHVAPYGEISIENMFGEEVGYVELTPWFVLPQSVRLREISWKRDMLYGKYTATLKLNRGYDNIVDEKQITFWVIPWKFITLGFIVLFIVFFLFRSFFKNFEFRRKTD